MSFQSKNKSRKKFLGRSKAHQKINGLFPVQICPRFETKTSKLCSLWWQTNPEENNSIFLAWERKRRRFSCWLGQLFSLLTEKSLWDLHYLKSVVVFSRASESLAVTHVQRLLLLALAERERGERRERRKESFTPWQPLPSATRERKRISDPRTKPFHAFHYGGKKCLREPGWPHIPQIAICFPRTSQENTSCPWLALAVSNRSSQIEILLTWAKKSKRNLIEWTIDPPDQSAEKGNLFHSWCFICGPVKYFHLSPLRARLFSFFFLWR